MSPQFKTIIPLVNFSIQAKVMRNFKENRIEHNYSKIRSQKSRSDF